jgi:hypothetical protein
MAERQRPIRIQIPEELRLSENEIRSLERVFLEQLQIVEAPGDVPAVPSQPINTTKMAVEIELIETRQTRARQVARKASGKAAGKKGRARSKK